MPDTKIELPQWVGAQLADVQGCRHGFYGRGGGVSGGVDGMYASLNCSYFSGDEARAVTENRKRIADDIGAEKIFTNQQFHGNRVRTVTKTTDPREVFEGDGLITREPHLALGILTADCAPVLFADPRARVIGAAHAGWRGALCGVLSSVIDGMTELGARAEDIVCAVGPAIQLASYQVGDDFRARFERESPVGVDCAECFSPEQHFNLPRYVQLYLTRVGIKKVDVLSNDTCADAKNFFSYRRSCQRGELDYGRQLSVVMLA